MLKHGILGLINYHKMTGYEIMQTFRDSLNFFWNAQTSQIYRELQTLEAKKWVDKAVVEQQGKPDKNVYSITEEGRTELLRWLGDSNPGLNGVPHRHSPRHLAAGFVRQTHYRCRPHPGQVWQSSGLAWNRRVEKRYGNIRLA